MQLATALPLLYSGRVAEIRGAVVHTGRDYRPLSAASAFSFSSESNCHRMLLINQLRVANSSNTKSRSANVEDGVVKEAVQSVLSRRKHGPLQFSTRRRDWQEVWLVIAAHFPSFSARRISFAMSLFLRMNVSSGAISAAWLNASTDSSAMIFSMKHTPEIEEERSSSRDVKLRSARSDSLLVRRAANRLGPSCSIRRYWAGSHDLSLRH